MAGDNNVETTFDHLLILRTITVGVVMPVLQMKHRFKTGMTKIIRIMTTATATVTMVAG